MLSLRKKKKHKCISFLPHQHSWALCNSHGFHVSAPAIIIIPSLQISIHSGCMNLKLLSKNLHYCFTFMGFVLTCTIFGLRLIAHCCSEDVWEAVLISDTQRSPTNADCVRRTVHQAWCQRMNSEWEPKPDQTVFICMIKCMCTCVFKCMT